jgi:hypothetical protein
MTNRGTDCAKCAELEAENALLRNAAEQTSKLIADMTSGDDLKTALNIGLAALGHFNTEQTDKHWNAMERELREIEKRSSATRRSDK